MTFPDTHARTRAYIGHTLSPHFAKLVTSNAQSELTALERGMHALHSEEDPRDLDVKAYAASVGRARGTVRDEVYAAEVADAMSDIRHELSPHFAKLVEIHAAPEWLWPALVAAMMASKPSWTVEQTSHTCAMEVT